MAMGKFPSASIYVLSVQPDDMRSLLQHQADTEKDFGHPTFLRTFHDPRLPIYYGFCEWNGN